MRSCARSLVKLNNRKCEQNLHPCLAISHLRTIPIERKTIEILAEHLLHLNFELKIFDHANLQFLLQVHQNVHLL